jgi:hypothetical protein
MEETLACCAIWPEILHRLEWMASEAEPDFLLMPHLKRQGGRLRVNFCPSCGADRRGAIVSRERVRALVVTEEE